MADSDEDLDPGSNEDFAVDVGAHTHMSYTTVKASSVVKELEDGTDVWRPRRGCAGVMRPRPRPRGAYGSERVTARVMAASRPLCLLGDNVDWPGHATKYGLTDDEVESAERGEEDAQDEKTIASRHIPALCQGNSVLCVGVLAAGSTSRCSWHKEPTLDPSPSPGRHFTRASISTSFLHATSTTQTCPSTNAHSFAFYVAAARRPHSPKW